MAMMRPDPEEPVVSEQQRRRRTLGFVLLLFAIPVGTLLGVLLF